MLVLSRREDDKIVFPNLGITVEVLRIAGRSVKLGVTAPRNVRVLRHELADNAEPVESLIADMTAGPFSNHALRNRLNTATIGLSLVQKQLELGRLEAADESLEKVLAEFQSLDNDLAHMPTVQGAHSRKALLVEDDANESELLAGFLRLSGFTVDRASDGCDALEYLAEHVQPDVVLLDMQMPRCDGPTTIQAIRRNPSYAGLKVFAVSGRVPADVGVTVGPTGVNRWFRKPLNPQSLVAELNHDLQTPQV
ncbi:MAG: response regulator [Pirellulaceae bacterium]